LEIEEPVLCRDWSSVDFYPTWAGMLGATLVGDQVVQMGQPDKKRLLAPVGMMTALDHEQCPVDGVRRLIEEGAGDGHTGGFADRLPPRLLVLEPAPDARAVGHPCAVRHVVGTVAEPLTQRAHAPALALPRPVQHSMQRRASGLADGRCDRRKFLRELGEGVAQAVAQTHPRQQRLPTLGGAGDAIAQEPPDPIRGLRLGRGALTRAVGLGQGRRPGRLSVAQRPEHAATDHRRQIPRLGQTTAVRLIGQAIDGQRQATPGQHGH
jgi:hypothetical protein